MNTIMKSLVTSLATGLTVFAFSGCAAPVESVDAPEVTEATQEAIGNCSCSGVYSCASDGYELDYFAVGCGIRTKPQAAQLCRTHCGGVACVDSGWIYCM
ncbi:MAG: hypothetical protein ABJE95_09620 [Byssovorax sp.]